MKKGKRKSFNKGFTLVELIVVLVILAVLAAVLVPALLGYIEKAKTKKSLMHAKQALEAVQAELVEIYGSTTAVPPEGTPVVSGARWNTDNSGKKNGDQDMIGSQFVKDVFSNLGISEDEEPYFFMVVLGSNASSEKASNDKVTIHDKYTVFYAMYKEKKDSKMLYFYEGDWSTVNPRYKEGSNHSKETFFNGYNVVQSGTNKGKRMQYYLLSYKGNAYKNDTVKSSQFWYDVWDGKI
ncbi:MAG: type II secretion system protein [Eubacterium sp.]|nr:type II secretion system protein [Eubacterium sp.]